MQIDWDKLRIFNVVVEAKSFTTAGERLNLSQSAVSRQIATLERSLGLQLFSRHPRGLVLTSEGERLYKSVARVFSQISAIQSELWDSKNEAKGDLKIACSVAFGSMWLPKRLPLFTKKYPDLRLILILSDEEVDLSMREADVAIGYGYTTCLNVAKHFLTHDNLQMYASSEYLATHGVPIYVEDLDRHRLIVFGTHTTPPYEGINWILKVGAEMGHIREPHLAINNAQGILQAIRGGIGIGALPHFIAKDYPDLIPVLPECKGPSFDFFVIYPNQLEGSKKVQAFREFISLHMGT